MGGGAHNGVVTLPPRPLSAAIFDLGGVLTEPPFDRLRRVVLGHPGAAEEAAAR